MSHENHPLSMPQDFERLGTLAASLVERVRHHDDELCALRARTAVALDHARIMTSRGAIGGAEVVGQIEARLPIDVPVLQEVHATVADVLVAVDRMVGDGEALLAAASEAMAILEANVATFERAGLELAVPAPKPSSPEPEPVPEPPPHDERRRTQRVPVDCSVDFESDSNFYSGFVTDLSSLGIFVATYDALDPGTSVVLSFTLPSGVRVDAPAEVRWVRDENPYVPDMIPGMGLQFEQMRPEHLEAVQTFLVQREPLFYPEGLGLV